jgi:hypothetical protein
MYSIEWYEDRLWDTPSLLSNAYWEGGGAGLKVNMTTGLPAKQLLISHVQGIINGNVTLFAFDWRGFGKPQKLRPG